MPCGQFVLLELRHTCEQRGALGTLIRTDQRRHIFVPVRANRMSGGELVLRELLHC
eukprot:CAMPEP_0204246860 /NCGR_PEP_ID=MMETSP0361-20130328/98357_1 /ASSEMBLY_ACC=CAM_ASM_000343 /TAXON_ID=268821 /ORGANISM="Scrippsiella Hangoei, Strain SHTV-5" /LENGTH=55 /DNA_ID=CAMNT_0051220089 /DNA_START=898 /DNA_END=1065 /DNA_ORIENTATION=-